MECVVYVPTKHAKTGKSQFVKKNN